MKEEPRAKPIGLFTVLQLGIGGCCLGLGSVYWIAAVWLGSPRRWFGFELALLGFAWTTGGVLTLLLRILKGLATR